MTHEKELHEIDVLIAEIESSLEHWNSFNTAAPLTDKYIQSRFSSLISGLQFYRKEFAV